jgi:N-acetylated-alpha-linked acidic dipeptidase
VLAAAGAEIWSARRRAGFVGRESGRVARLVEPARIGERTARVASAPHRAGSSSNAEVAGFVGETLQRAGLKVWNTPFEAEVYEPLVSRLTLEEREGRTEYDLSEPGDGDPAFLAYSPDADVAAPVVFANEGSRADYEFLAKKGIDVRGKLALVRAQGICRSMKTEVAGSRGVAGLLVYPEPRDQGEPKPAWPDGPGTPAWAVPRGTLLRFYRYPGDPATAREKGIDNLPPVPALGVSQAVAEDLLSRMRGEAVPEPWKGRLKTPYVLAAEGPRVRAVVRGQLVRKSLRNVFAILPGTNGDARPVMLGNHYDAWERGAVDAASGTAVVLEVAEALAKLHARGWTPERSVLFAFWDGEEPGLFGSARWVEQALRDRFGGLAAYVNVDSAVRAEDFAGDVMPGLRAPLEKVLAAVRDPATGKTLAETHGAFQLPGFSSDASPFLGLTGTPVAELGFGRHYPVYHTRADTVEWIRRFGDPGFARAGLLARVVALYVGSLASEPIVPYRFSEVSDFTRTTLRELENRGASFGEWGTAARGLRDALDSYETTARRWDDAQRRLAGLSLAKARAVAPLVEQAMGAVAAAGGGRAAAYGRGSLLVGPFKDDLCEAEAHAAFVNAVRSRDFEAIGAEGGDRTRAFARAQQLLRAAEWIAFGPGGPGRRARN